MKRLINGLIYCLLFIPGIALADAPITTHLVVVEDTPTIQNSAYAAGDLVTPKIELAGAVRDGVFSGLIQQVTITDLGAEAKDVELIVFDADPSSSTLTVNSAFDPDDTDLLNIICRITVSSHSSFNDNGVSSADNVGCPVDTKAADSTSLYAVLVAREAVTYDTTAALTIRVGIIQD